MGPGNFEQEIKDYLDRCLNGEEISTEMWFDMPGEGRQCFEINYIPYCDNNGAITHAIMVGHNITKRKIVEQELNKSYQKLQKALEEPFMLYLLLLRCGIHIRQGTRNE